MSTGILQRAGTPAPVSHGFDLQKFGMTLFAVAYSLLCLDGRAAEAAMAIDPGRLALVRQLRERILRTAAQHNQVNVGVYAAVLRGGAIRRGDPVRLE
jgi:hypothetical protein